MKNEPEGKFKKIYWVISLIAVLVIIAARVVCELAGVTLSDTATRVFGGAEIVAVAAMVYCYMKWRRQQSQS